MIIQAPLENFPTDDEIADTLRVNKIIEDVVRQAPAQYFWVHRRFKRNDGIDPYKIDPAKQESA